MSVDKRAKRTATMGLKNGMRMRHVLLVICGILLTMQNTHSMPGAPLEIAFFGASSCGLCEQIKADILQPLSERYSEEKLNIQIFDIDKPEHLALLEKMEAMRSITTPSGQTLFFPDTVLLGYKTIFASARTLIEQKLADTNAPRSIQWPEQTNQIAEQQPHAATSRSSSHGPKTGEIIRDLLFFVLGIVVVVFRTHRGVLIGAQLALGIIFIIAGGGKIEHTTEMEVILRAYKILPEFFLPIAATLLPWLELVIGVGLISGLWSKISGLSVVILHLFFIPALAIRTTMEAATQQVSWFSVTFDCGCGLGENVAWILILRDIGFLLIGYMVWKRAQRFNALQSFSPQ